MGEHTKTILVFSHHHNSFDKKMMLKDSNQQFFKESPKKVTDFIQKKKEKNIYDFFMKHIDSALEKYEPGKPENKPDVLEQLKEITEEREKMEKLGKNGGTIMIDTPGEGRRPLQPQEVVVILTQQKNQIQFLINRVKELEETILQLEMKHAQAGI